MAPRQTSKRRTGGTKGAVVKRPSMAEEATKATGKEVAEDQVAETERSELMQHQEPASSSAASIPRMGGTTPATTMAQAQDSDAVPTMTVELVCMGKSDVHASLFLYNKDNEWDLRTFRGPQEVMDMIHAYRQGDEVAQVLEATLKVHPNFTTYYLRDPRDYSGFITSVRIKGIMIGSIVESHMRAATTNEQQLEFLKTNQPE